MPAILISGTDTGVGKTKVGCDLARLFKECGLRVGVMKPAETGCAVRDGELEPADAIALKEASGCAAALAVVCPYRYSTPVAPAVAAEMEGKAEPDFSVIKQRFLDLTVDHDIVIVEGAGGLLVPITWEMNYADLASKLGLRLILVVGNRLGCINTTLLSLHYARQQNLDILGYILNDIEAESSPASTTNEASLKRLVPERLLARVGYGGHLSRDSANEIGRLLGLNIF